MCLPKLLLELTEETMQQYVSGSYFFLFLDAALTWSLPQAAEGQFAGKEPGSSQAAYVDTSSYYRWVAVCDA